VYVCARNDYANHLLFHLENVLVEMLLQRLVGVIDAKLFETVDLERLEAENVEDADVRRRIPLPTDPRASILPLFGSYAAIDRLDDVIEVGAVHRLYQPLGRLVRLLGVELLGDVPLLQNQDAGREGRGEVLVRHPEEGGDRDGRAVLDEDAGLALVRFGEGHVPRVEDGDDQAHDVSDRSLVESHDSLRGGRFVRCATEGGRRERVEGNSEKTAPTR
jgi:hypothetical protein